MLKHAIMALTGKTARAEFETQNPAARFDPYNPPFVEAESIYQQFHFHGHPPPTRHQVLDVVHGSTAPNGERTFWVWKHTKPDETAEYWIAINPHAR